MKKIKFSFLDLLMNNWLIRHSLFWLFILLYFVLGGVSPGSYFQMDWNRFFNSGYGVLTKVIKFVPAWLITVYPLLYILIPRLLLKRKFLAFALSLLVLLIFGTFLGQMITAAQIQNIGVKETGVWKASNLLLPVVHVCGIAASIKVMKYFFMEERRSMQALQQKTFAELELLKAQIHPHFLFNTLNNLYAHTINNSAKSPEIVLKLSDLLRFMVYESRSEKIQLEQEIRLLKDYIDLEELRYGDKLEMSVTLSGDYHHKFIAPLLLLPLVENCFKHGASTQTGKSWITLNMDVQEEIFNFKLINSKDHGNENDGGKTSHKGVGMENVRKRLDLIYHGKHNLQVTTDDDYFMVTLSLKLDLIPPSNLDSRTATKPTSHDIEMPVG
jgi:hypothetical protein